MSLLVAALHHLSDQGYLRESKVSIKPATHFKDLLVPLAISQRGGIFKIPGMNFLKQREKVQDGGTGMPSKYHLWYLCITFCPGVHCSIKVLTYLLAFKVY